MDKKVGHTPEAPLLLPGGERITALVYGQLVGETGSVLAAYRIPMEEAHLYGGVGGGWSRMPLAENGRQKTVSRVRAAKYCPTHNGLYLADSGCPLCNHTEG